MKTYQKPTITDIRLEDSSTANMQGGVNFCVNRDARSTAAAGATPCGSTDNQFNLTPSAIPGCDGTMIYPDPSIVSAVFQGGDTDAINAISSKGWDFLENDSYDAPCAGNCSTPTTF